MRPLSSIPERTGGYAPIRAIGFVMHLGFRLLFSLIYYAIFVSIERGGWLLGALLGVVHALFAGAALVNILLPAVHPRMGTVYTAADSSPYLEPPGFIRSRHNAELG